MIGGSVGHFLGINYYDVYPELRNDRDQQRRQQHLRPTQHSRAQHQLKLWPAAAAAFLLLFPLILRLPLLLLLPLPRLSLLQLHYSQ